MRPFDPKDYRTLNGVQECIRELEEEFRNGDGRAGYSLSHVYCEGNAFIPREFWSAIGVADERAVDYSIRSFELLKRSAEAGDGECMHLVAMYYQAGSPPVNVDEHLFKVWNDRSFAAGYFGAIDDLLAIYGDPKSQYYDRAKARELRRILLSA